jgi:hypothetical protein
MDVVEVRVREGNRPNLSTAMFASRNACESKPIVGCQAFDAPVSINVTSVPSSSAKALTDSLRFPSTRRTCLGRSSPNTLFARRRNRVAACRRSHHAARS